MLSSTTMKSAEYLKKPYSRIVVPEPDGSFRAEIAEFPGCLAIGDTAEEALRNLENVAESWLESVLARGRAVPEPLETYHYSGKLVLRLPKSLHQKAAIAAARDGVSLNTYISNCLAEYIGWQGHARFSGNTQIVTAAASFLIGAMTLTSRVALSDARHQVIVSSGAHSLSLPGSSFSPIASTTVEQRI